MATVIVTIEAAQAKLPELIDHLAPGEEVVITRGEKPIARLVSEARTRNQPRRAGSAKDVLKIVSDDDEHLADFSEYME